jgi:hypothetical protein
LGVGSKEEADLKMHWKGIRAPPGRKSINVWRKVEREFNCQIRIKALYYLRLFGVQKTEEKKTEKQSKQAYYY